MLLRPLGCLVMAVLWPLEGGLVKSKLAASGLAAGEAASLWRGVWFSVGGTNQRRHNKSLQPTAYSYCWRTRFSNGWTTPIISFRRQLSMPCGANTEAPMVYSLAFSPISSELVNKVRKDERRWRCGRRPACQEVTRSRLMALAKAK